MARHTTFKELGAVSLNDLQPRLHTLLADSAICVFRDRSDPNSPPKDELVMEHLTVPLQWLLCGGDPATVFAGLEQSKTPSVFCGKVFKSGEPAYFCKDCQTDPTCCLCMECFEHSEHKDHRYRFFASGGGGCCDCGDPEAWKSGVYCDLHQPSQQNDDQVDPVQALSSNLADRARRFFTTLLCYCMEVMTWEGLGKLPPHIQTGLTSESLLKDNFQTFLYNDELHSFDEVIHILTHSVGLTHTEAVSMATFIDRKGRAVTKHGPEEECLQAKDSINTGLNLPLGIHVYHDAVVAHQNTAILCLSLAKDLAEKSAAFGRLLSLCMCDVGRDEQTLLDKFFLRDSQLWINARVGWHRLVMSSIFMDTVYKKQLAISLAKNYLQLQKNFVADSHDHDVCATNITVQIFTVPSLSRMLVVEHGLLKIILNTLLELLAPGVSAGTLKLNSNNYKHNRVFYIMHDLRYVLRNKPDEWNDQLRGCVMDAYDSVLELLGMMQNADSVVRQRSVHLEREEPWEHLFNFSIVLQPALLLLVEWLTSDASLLKLSVAATLKKHSAVSKRNQILYRPHSVSQALVGKAKLELIAFDILSESVSIHQPLPRIIACLLTGASSHGLSMQQLLNIPPTDTRTPLFLIEHCSRAIVMAIQVMAGMWKRNGYSVVNQIINYQFHYSREIMYDKDVLLLQCMAAVLDHNVFTYALIYKFRLEKWINSPDADPTKRQGEPSDDALRFFISEAEDFLFLLISIFSERHSQGVGEGVSPTDALRREIIHRLFINPLIHSQIIKMFRLNENENQIDQLLKEVAVQRRAGNKMVFELKPDLEKEYSPFFFHYNRMDHSKAHEAYRKRNKPPPGAPRRVIPTPPSHPPRFTAPFQGIMKLSLCPVIHRILFCVLKQAACQESKFWSDKLIHEALFLCAILLIEEDPSNPGSLCNTAIGKNGDNAFLCHLEALKTNRRADEYLPLLEWVLHYLRSARDDRPGSPVPSIPMETSPPEPVGPTIPEPHHVEPDIDEEAIKKRKKLAQARREKVMSQMSSMQKKFLHDHQAELDSINSGRGGASGLDLTDAPPTQRGVGVASRIDHTPSPQEATCILCTEESTDIASQEKTFLQAVYVQRSAVLRRGEAIKEKKEMDFLSSRANLSHGLFTSGCGHHMHVHCWTGFLETKQQEHRRPHFFLVPGQSVQWESGEFLCPLCQSPSNSVLPLLTAPPLATPTERPTRELGIKEWREVTNMALELAEGDVIDTGSSVDPTFYDRLQTLFTNYHRATCQPSSSETAEEKLLSIVLALYTQAVFTRGYKANPDEKDERICIAQWNNCAYTISSFERNARYQDKFLLHANTLSVRQMDTVRSLVRLGSISKIRSSVKTIAKYLRHLSNVFLHESPPFSDLPSLLEMDTFAMLVNLHFAHASLYTALTSPQGSHEAQAASGVIPALVGMSDQHIVHITAAAHILQYLLSCPPAMETETPDRSGSSPEFSVGVGLQNVWLQYRQAAGLPADSPPSPYDLYAGVQQHLYPFLECSTLFFHCLSGVEFLYSSDCLATRFEDLCRYVGVPAALHTLFDSTPPSPSSADSANIIPDLAKNWCSHPKIKELISASNTLPVALLSPRQLISLPRRYSELVKKTSSFQCPSRSRGGSMEDSQAAMLCLVCGQMLCSNSYCCQVEVGVDEGGQEERGTVRIGGFTSHAQSCGAGLGMALWILESFVVLLDATDPTNVKGCTVTPPYLDEYGEADPGLRRGNPLHLNDDMFRDLRLIWFHHRIPERICKETEENRSLIRITWGNM